MKTIHSPLFIHTLVNILLSILLMIVLYACGASANEAGTPPETISLPVVEIKALPASTHRDIPATLEGKVNVEIRPQVDGYLEKIYVDEGAFVQIGQPLFRINDRPYREQLHNAQANLMATQASLEKAQLEVDRLTPLVQHKVVSDIQLKTAQAAYQTAQANVAQAQAMMGNARINLGYAVITAPVSGFIGRIPYKPGSLVGRAEPQPLTVLSDVAEVYAYFSMSEVDFLEFTRQTSGESLREKISQLPPVELLLADNNLYAQKGRIEMVSGQFDKAVGAISFRASFPNPDGLLRSGITGRIRIPQAHPSAVVIPQEATFEMQDKVMVFAVADSNQVVSRAVEIADRSGTYYLIEKGIKPGERIVLTGHGRLRDGVAIRPQPVSMDSLLKATPL